MTKTPKQRVIEVLEKMIPDDARDVKFNVSFEAKGFGSDPTPLFSEHVLQEIVGEPPEYIRDSSGEVTFFNVRTLHVRGSA